MNNEESGHSFEFTKAHGPAICSMAFRC
ncbi:MAG: hypothetical protein ACPGTS_01310, partial [Minisyncoccia bacterium]